MRILWLLVMLCLGGWLYNNPQVWGNSGVGSKVAGMLGISAQAQAPAKIYPHEDANYYYLTPDEVQEYKKMMDAQAPSRNFHDITLSTGAHIHILYSEDGPICPQTGRPVHVEVRPAKTIAVIVPQ